MNKRNNGFTLIELLIVMVLLGGLVAGIVWFADSMVSGGSLPNGSAGSQTAYSASGLPSNFQVVERALALSNTFDVVSGGQTYGTVTKKILSLTTSFTYTDNAGSTIATARKSLVSWGTQIEVFDSSGRLIGTIKEQVFNSMFKMSTVYSILDAGGSEAATSHKIDFLSTSITLYDGSGAQVATLNRPAINLVRDTWSVSVNNQAAVDSRVLVMIGAYKTSADNSK